MFRKHRFAVLGVAVLSLSMLLAVAAETLLWVAEGDDFYGRSFERRYIRLKENRPGQELVDVPDEAYLAARDSLEPRGFAWGTDADGFLLPSPSHERADYSIVFLGGSSTECRFVTEDKRFPYLAGRLLEDRLGWTVNAYNGGVRGNNSLHSINIFLNKVLPLKPDVVVLMHNINVCVRCPHDAFAPE